MRTLAVGSTSSKLHAQSMEITFWLAYVQIAITKKGWMGGTSSQDCKLCIYYEGRLVAVVRDVTEMQGLVIFIYLLFIILRSFLESF